MLKDKIIALDAALTGMSPIIVNWTFEKQGVNGIVNGQPYFLSDVWSRMQWINGHLSLWDQSSPYVKENWQSYQSLIAEVEGLMREAIHAI